MWKLRPEFEDDRAVGSIVAEHVLVAVEFQSPRADCCKSRRWLCSPLASSGCELCVRWLWLVCRGDWCLPLCGRGSCVRSVLLAGSRSRFRLEQLVFVSGSQGQSWSSIAGCRFCRRCLLWDGLSTPCLGGDSRFGRWRSGQSACVSLVTLTGSGVDACCACLGRLCRCWAIIASCSMSPWC